MRILYLGDLFGEDALKVLEQNLESIKKDNKINLVFINAENTTQGRGLSLNHYKRLMKLQIAGITMGNHTYSKSEILDYIDLPETKICRPANLPDALGKSYLIINYNGMKICLINVLGRALMSNTIDCPFKTVDNILASVKADYYILDIHAEATSEKRALGLYFDGRIDLIVGTHTHIQTADEECLPKGSLYITDLGMCGPKDSVIGNTKEEIILRFKSGVYTPAKVAKGSIILSGVIVDTNLKTINRFKKEYRS